MLLFKRFQRKRSAISESILRRDFLARRERKPAHAKVVRREPICLGGGIRSLGTRRRFLGDRRAKDVPHACHTLAIDAAARKQPSNKACNRKQIRDSEYEHKFEKCLHR
jgi:hypothetical protein